MAKSTVGIPQRAYKPGTRTVVLPDLTADDHGIRIAMTMAGWPDTGEDVITCEVEASNDGTEWFGLATFKHPGGVHLNPNTGKVVEATGFTVFWPARYIDGVPVPQRPAHARARITNTVALSTEITLTGV